MLSPRILVHVEDYIDTALSSPFDGLSHRLDVSLVVDAALRLQEAPTHDESDRVEPERFHELEVALLQWKDGLDVGIALEEIAELVDAHTPEDDRPPIAVDDSAVFYVKGE